MLRNAIWRPTQILSSTYQEKRFMYMIVHTILTKFVNLSAYETHKQHNNERTDNRTDQWKVGIYFKSVQFHTTFLTLNSATGLYTTSSVYTQILFHTKIK